MGIRGGDGIKQRSLDELLAQQIEDRAERMAAVGAWSDAYIEKNGARPPDRQLELLADYILREELTDPDRHKVSRTEYPFLSEYQFAYRRGFEVPEGVAKERGLDGRNHGLPARRKRTRREQRFLDKIAKIRNRARAAQYRRDTAPGPVHYEKSAPFTLCRGIGARWRSLAEVTPQP